MLGIQAACLNYDFAYLLCFHILAKKQCQVSRDQKPSQEKEEEIQPSNLPTLNI